MSGLSCAFSSTLYGVPIALAVTAGGALALTEYLVIPHDLVADLESAVAALEV